MIQLRLLKDFQKQEANCDLLKESSDFPQKYFFLKNYLFFQNSSKKLLTPISKIDIQITPRDR